MERLRLAGRVHAVARELARSAPNEGAAELRERAHALVDAVDARDLSVGGLAEWALARGGFETLTLHAIASVHALALARPSAGRRAERGSRPPTSLPVLSFDAISRSRTTLMDFTNFYFPLHRLQHADFFRWLPLLVFVEACIYQRDEDNEALCSGYARAVGAEAIATSTATAAPATRPRAVESALRGVLESRGLLSERVRSELEAGEEYWAIERELCAAMAAGEPIELARVYRASSLKSFDYRVLHALLCQLSGSAASEALLRFLRLDEQLTDVADDLFDYEKDVRHNSFNVLRGAAHARGAEAPLALAERIGALEAEHAARLAELPDWQREAYCAKRDAAMANGRDRWVFPPLVLPAQEAEARRLAAEGEVEADAQAQAQAQGQGQSQGQAAAAAAVAGVAVAVAADEGDHSDAEPLPTFGGAWPCSTREEEEPCASAGSRRKRGADALAE